VKVINPTKKSDIIVRQLHNFYVKFTSVNALRVKLIEQFQEQVPDTLKFSVGYFDGRHQMSLVSCDDLHGMYSKYKFGGEIVLWCSGRCQEVDARKCRKRESDTGLLKRQEKEEELEGVFKDLKGRHNEKYTLPQLRLWARMISSSIHNDMDNPPDIPAFRGSCKRPRKETFIEAIADAAVTIKKAFSTNDPPSSGASHGVTGVTAGISPGKTVELRMKNLEQLRYLQHLFDDGILNEKEFAEQKNSVLSSLRKL